MAPDFEFAQPGTVCCKPTGLQPSLADRPLSLGVSILGGEAETAADARSLSNHAKGLRGLFPVACAAECAAGCSLFAFGGFDGTDDVAALSHLRVCASFGQA